MPRSEGLDEIMSTQQGSDGHPKISAAMVKALREKTGAGFNDCRDALIKANGDMDAAAAILREKGQATAKKKEQRAASEGAIGDYLHAGGRIASLVEVNCESDFVARTEEFQRLCHDLAMHVAALNPRFVRREDVPVELVEQLRATFREQAASSGKPENVLDRIADGKLDKFFAETCLYEQHFIKEEQLTVRELIQQSVAKVGENIAVRRFARFKVGEHAVEAEPGPAAPEAAAPPPGPA